MDKKRKKLEKVINDDEVRSRVIRDAAAFDFWMMIMIGMYFCSAPRTVEFFFQIGERLSFNDKLSILRKLKYEKHYKSLECLDTIGKIQRLRNVLAHHHYVAHFNRVFRDDAVVKWLQDYPVTYDKDVKRAKDQLRRLGKTKEFSRYQNDE